MKNELLIFGAEGALGKGISKVLTAKNYDKVYLLDFKLSDITYPGIIEKIEYKDLSIEENLVDVFARITPGKNKNLFLYSTVGGFFGGKKVWETTESDWDKMFSMNLKTSFFIAKHFALKVRECSGGSILMTAAFTAMEPEPGKAAYGASKRGLVHFIETLAYEGKAINLTANAIAPYIIDTPANREWGSEADIADWIKPEEIGAFAHSVFTHFQILSGNIFKLKIRLAQHP